MRTRHRLMASSVVIGPWVAILDFAGAPPTAGLRGSVLSHSRGNASQRGCRDAHLPGLVQRRLAQRFHPESWGLVGRGTSISQGAARILQALFKTARGLPGSRDVSIRKRWPRAARPHPSGGPRQQRSGEWANRVVQAPEALHAAHLAGSCFWLRSGRHAGRRRAVRGDVH